MPIKPKGMVNWHPETEPFGMPFEDAGVFDKSLVAPYNLYRYT